MNKKNNAGFTLFEIIIAIAILSILVAIGIPNFFSLKKSIDLDNNVQGIISALKLAQNKTLSSENDSQYGVFIDTAVSPNRYVLFKGADYVSREPDADVVYYLENATEFYDISLGGGNEIVFDRVTGASEEAGSLSVRMSTDTERNKTIYIANSGAVGFAPPAASYDGSRIKDSRHVRFDYSRTIDTATESLTLIFDSSVSRPVPISSFLVGGQLKWRDVVNVGGVDQVIEIDTRKLNDSGTVFTILRDKRYNDKSLDITISGDSSGYLAQYSADGLEVNHSSIYASNFIWQ